MLARDLMAPRPPCVDTGTPISRIIHLMLDGNISAVMVTAQDGSLVGVVSEGDLIRRKAGAYKKRLDRRRDPLAEGEPLNLEFLRGLQIGKATAATIMTSPVLTLDEQADLAEIAEVLLKHSIKRVPITRDGKLVGIISRRDILRALADQDNGFA